MSLQIEQLHSPTQPIRDLIQELDAELNSIYSAEQRHGLDIARLFRPGVLFFIATLDAHPAGCGGIAFDDGLAEVKRMYVRPQSRHRGVAQALLARLAEEARAKGATHLVLETGDAQLAAIRLYERAGFVRRPAFGAYTHMSPDSIKRSIFFEKGID